MPADTEADWIDFRRLRARFDEVQDEPVEILRLMEQIVPAAAVRWDHDLPDDSGTFHLNVYRGAPWHRVDGSPSTCHQDYPRKWHLCIRYDALPESDAFYDFDEVLERWVPTRQPLTMDDL